MQGISYLTDVGIYVPRGRVSNKDLCELTGKPPDWFMKRTGIETRSRAEDHESTSSMACRAVDALLENENVTLDDIDLVLGGSYTPDDTLATLAHRVQRAFGLHHANSLYLSTACTTFISLLDLASLYIRAGRAKRVLVVVAEHNSQFSSDFDPMSGHLWGDGAAAVIVQKNRGSCPWTLDAVTTYGLGTLGNGWKSLSLSVFDREIHMPNGREVFELACKEMARAANEALEARSLTVPELSAVIAHQANNRIIQHVAGALGLEAHQCPTTVQQLGNTGSASIPITWEHTTGNYYPGDHILLVAFGGGYSSGTAILTKN